jgi:hypothetical protein
MILKKELMEKNNFLEHIRIDNPSKSFVIIRPIFVFFSEEEVNDVLNHYEENYREYKLFYCERGEPITLSTILHLYRVHEFFLEKKINTKKFNILYENRSEEYEKLLGFFQFNFYYYPYHLNFVTPPEFFNSGQYPYRLEKDFEKTFLSLNRAYKPHKQIFKNFFYNNGFQDISYYSFLWKDEKNFEENYIQSTHANHDKLIHLYQNTAINLLCESQYDKNGVPIESTFISEKTFRALAFPRPFIVIGQKHILKNLQKMGFRTFSDIIDESYDDLPDSERMDKIQQIILDLKTKNKEEIYHMWEKCIEIYEHNRKSILYHANSYNEMFQRIFPKEFRVLNDEYFASIERTKKLKDYDNS